MIYIRLAGGLGNQLYQLAAALLLAAGSGQKIMPLTGAMHRYATPRTPDALKLFDDGLFAPASTVPAWLAFAVLSGRIGRWMPGRGVHDRNFAALLARAGNRSTSLYLDGYFQQGWTTQRLAPLMQLVKRPTADSGASDEYTCAMHIRGGDFLGLPHMQVAGEPYYRAAVQQACMRGFRRFLIVTDDPGYAAGIASQLARSSPGSTFSIRGGNSTVLDDFWFLSNARGRIISNSTFAWWACALDERRSPTWSPGEVQKGVPRDGVLPWEMIVSEKR